MSLVPLGEFTLGVAVPGAAAGFAAGIAGINGALPQLSAQLTALASFSPSLGNFPADIALAQQIIASIQAAIAAGLSPPTIGAQLAVVAALVADLTAQLTAIQVQLAILVELSGVLSVGGVFAYAYDGRADGFGPALGAALATGFPGSTGAAAANGLVFGTVSPAAWVAMRALFRTS